jgi:hypothetical protein
MAGFPRFSPCSTAIGPGYLLLASRLVDCDILRLEMLVSSASTVILGSLSMPLWLIVLLLALSRLIPTINSKKIGDMLMKITLNTVQFLLISSSEGVWDIGTKVVAA